jgi:hypothetical protein
MMPRHWAIEARRLSLFTIMTNRDMVKDPKPGGPKLPEPNVPKPEAPVPAPEDDPYLFTTNDPVDSPQANPVINPRPRSRVLGGCVAELKPKVGPGVLLPLPESFSASSI